MLREGGRDASRSFWNRGAAILGLEGKRTGYGGISAPSPASRWAPSSPFSGASRLAGGSPDPLLFCLFQELKLPAFRAHSPLLKSRRFFVDILTLLSSHCQLCPAARHLAVYLLDHFLDRYNIPASKQLYAVAVSCLLLASTAAAPPSAASSVSLGAPGLGTFPGAVPTFRARPVLSGNSGY